MKKWVILVGILFILVIGGYFVLSFYAVRFIQPRFQKGMGPGLTLAEMTLKTTYLAARGIQYEDPDSKQKFIQIEEVRIYPSPLSLFGKSLRIKEFTIHQPSVFFYRSWEGVLVGPGVMMKKEREGKEASREGEKKKGEPIHILIDRIRIQRGAVDFEDRKMGAPSAQFKLRDLNFEIKNIQYPLASRHSPIELKGKVKGKKQEGSIETKGWIDLNTADLEISLKVREIEVEAFKPYYRKKVSAEIDSGTMNLESQIVLKGKRIDAPGELQFVNLHMKEGGGTVFWIPAETLTSLLEKKGNQIKAPFHVKGNLEDPQFNLQEAFLTQIAFSLTEALGLPIKSLGGSVGGTGKGMEGLLEGIKSIEEMFKKKREKKR
jgi:uncharacterized protein involved in outer membrane biogenesis